MDVCVEGAGCSSDLPEGVSLFRKDVEELLSQLDRRKSLQLQVGPTLDKLDQRLKGVEAQAVVAVVGQVSHEDTDLDREETVRFYRLTVQTPTDSPHHWNHWAFSGLE